MRGASGNDADEDDELSSGEGEPSHQGEKQPDEAVESVREDDKPPDEAEKPSREGDRADREESDATDRAADGDGQGSEHGTAAPEDADAVDGRTDAEPGSNPPEAAGNTAETGAPEASEIDASALTVSERSLHPRIRILWVVRAVLWSLIIGAIAAAITWQYLEVTLLAPAALAAVLLVLFVAHAIFRYRAWQYEFREDAIYLERGVLTRVRTVVPFVRIQHVDTARGPIERAAGLSTLVVYTAGSRGADVTIPGIEAERATDHQRRLKQLAIAAEDDTAV